MAESVFEAVKQSITVREAAQMYGIEVNRSGMACCPFHDDKNPSMKLNEEYFYCFGCGATGDVIDFAVRLYNLSPREAAEKLAQDFGLAYDSQAPPRRRYVRQKTEAQKFKEDRDHDRLMNLLPFRSLAFTGMKGLPGTYATILASEDRTKELRNPRASVREHLKQEPKQTAAKALTHKKKEPER